MRLPALCVYAMIIALSSPTVALCTSLPRGFGIGTAESMKTATQMHADMQFIHWALNESALDAVATAKVDKIVVATEAKLQTLAAREKDDPEKSATLDKQAAVIREQFDKRISNLLTPDEVEQWGHKATIVFFQELFGLGQLLNTPGINITVKQRADLKPTAEKAADAQDALFVSSDTDREAKRAAAVAAELAFRHKLRVVLTADQLRKLDAVTLDAIKQAQKQMNPATEP
jgi:hypothetical protein